MRMVIAGRRPRTLRGSAAPAWLPRAHRGTAQAARLLETAARGLLVIGVAAAVLIWLVSVGILVHDMVSWWAELAVRPLQTTVEGPPPGW